MSSDVVNLDPFFALGFIGVLIVATGFVLNQLGIWNVKNFEYDLINLLGGGILVFYAYQIESWPFLILFIVWSVFSLKDCLFDFFHRFDWKKRKRK